MTATGAAELAGCCPDSGLGGRSPLFPLPAPGAVPFERPGLSRRCKQRADRRRHLREDTADALSSLNWCASQAMGPTEVTPAIHADVTARVERCVFERGCPDTAQSEEAAARELLRSRVGYGAGPTTVEVFRRGAVALPESVRNAPLLSEVLSEADRAVLEGFRSHMLGDTVDIFGVTGLCGGGHTVCGRKLS